MKNALIFIILSNIMGACYWIDEFSSKCKEESAIWGNASARGSENNENCERFRMSFFNTGTTIDGVMMRCVLGKTGDGPKELVLTFRLTTGEDIRNYEFNRPIKLTFNADTYDIESSNPDIEAAFDSGFSNTIYEKFDIEIDQKRRDKENYRGYIKCEGTFFKGYNLDGSLNYEPFKYDLKFDTDNN